VAGSLGSKGRAVKVLGKLGFTIQARQRLARQS
jgi:hypothetical protein